MFATEARRYLAERILRPRIVLLWLLLLAGCLAAGDFPPARWPWPALVCALFILAFRLWDDLADREHDRARHADRCLVRAAEVRPFHIALWLLLAALAGLLGLLAGAARGLALLALVSAFLALYRLTAGRPGARPWRVALVLAKYPACVLLLARDPGAALAPLAALGVYLPLLLHEARDSGPAILPPAAVFLGLAGLAWLGLTT